MPLHAEPAPLQEPRCYRPLLLRPACCLPADVTLLLLSPPSDRSQPSPPVHDLQQWGGGGDKAEGPHFINQTKPANKYLEYG
jgi:hypothetical protein